MDLLKEMQKIFSDTDFFVETKNYYYENHKCEKNGETKKVQLDFVVSNDTTDKILRLGHCPECKTLFYHKDFNTKSF